MEINDRYVKVKVVNKSHNDLNVTVTYVREWQFRYLIDDFKFFHFKNPPCFQFLR